MVQPFFVRFHRCQTDCSRSNALLQGRFPGRYGVSILHVALKLDIESSSPSFGGAFELMKSGGDNDGNFDTVGSGMRYLSALAGRFTRLICLLAFLRRWHMSHILYLSSRRSLERMARFSVPERSPEKMC